MASLPVRDENPGTDAGFNVQYGWAKSCLGRVQIDNGRLALHVSSVDPSRLEEGLYARFTIHRSSQLQSRGGVLLIAGDGLDVNMCPVGPRIEDGKGKPVSRSYPSLPCP